MENELVQTIRQHAKVMFHNAQIAVKTCAPDEILFGVPLWKHIYHMLHSCDQWFIDPARYAEPAFHEDGLNDIDRQPGACALSREQLLDYLARIREKTLAYLDGLTDARLTEKPEGCLYSRFSLMLGAFRHLYAHLGNINAVTMRQTGKWPRVAGMYWLREPDDSLWE